MRLLLLNNNIQKQPTRYIKRLASSSTTSTTTAKTKRPKFGRYQFLTPGFQPTTIIGDSIGFYHGSTFFEGVPPDTLPIIDASVILSPGRYCKKSSWSTLHHRHKGTRSGVDAAQRLVDARRDFFDLIQNELSNIGMEDSSTRKIYAITGHGVPTSLIQHMVDVARSWLSLYHPSSSSTNNKEEEIWQHTTNNEHSQSLMNTQILFTNQHNSTLLNQDQIRIIDMHGITQTLPSLPNEWKDDLELYMVVMHRIGSRLASMAMPPNNINNSNAYLFDSNNNTDDDVDDGDNTYVGKPEKINDDTLVVGIGSSSVVTPSQLKRWNVTIMKGESLPSSLLPGCNTNNVVKGNDKRRKQMEGNLTIEWKKKRNDCWNVILRLQDEGQSDRECPISLVFDGEYIPP